MSAGEEPKFDLNPDGTQKTTDSTETGGVRSNGADPHPDDTRANGEDHYVEDLEFEASSPDESQGEVTARRPVEVPVRIGDDPELILRLPRSFSVEDGQLEVWNPKLKKHQKFASGVMFVVGRYKDVSDKSNHITIAYRSKGDYDKGILTFDTLTIPHQGYGSKQLSLELLRVGIQLRTEISGKSFLWDVEEENSEAVVSGFSHARTGWVRVRDNGEQVLIFVTPSGSIGPVPVRLTMADPKTKKMLDKFGQKGTLEGQLDFFRWAIERYPAVDRHGIRTPLTG